MPIKSHGGALISPDITFSSYVYCTLWTKVPAMVIRTPKSASYTASLPSPSGASGSALAPTPEDMPTRTTATPIRATPAHIGGVSLSLRMKFFMRATKTMPPPRSSIQIEALMCSSPKTIKQVAMRSKTDGMARSMYVCDVTCGSAMILAYSSGVAFLRRRHSEMKWAGSANVMPRNMTHVWKSGGSKSSSSPVLPMASHWKRAFEAMVQPVPAARPIMNTAAARASHVSVPL
mmetsp:Transcript_45196/g.125343  ORF Transcript_45196/g.125343 Transcript_45196/m.125343 type:complete len:233 (+) Transcript_45196:664-1362(+)